MENKRRSEWQERSRKTGEEAAAVRVPPAVRKFALCHFAFTKDLHSYLFSLPERNPKRVFAFKKKAKSENAQFCRELF